MGDFRYDVRVLVCPTCAGPYEADVGGGDVTCGYCGNTAVVRPRSVDTEVVGHGLTELQRDERLRADAGKPLMPPESIRHFLKLGVLDASKVDEATAEYQRTRGEVEAGSTVAAQDRLYFLGLLLGGHYSRNDEEERHRALLEQTLDLLTERKHTQVLTCMISRLAARQGDVDDAEAWLNHADPCPDDLLMDTSYRQARATIDTARGDWKAVLVTLGHRPEDVPIHLAQREITTLLRANAHERKGDVELAAQQVLAVAKKAGMPFMDKVVRVNATLDLVPKAMPIVRKKMPRGCLAALFGG